MNIQRESLSLNMGRFYITPVRILKILKLSTRRDRLTGRCRCFRINPLNAYPPRVIGMQSIIKKEE
jgi:hypothetical protein